MHRECVIYRSQRKIVWRWKIDKKIYIDTIGFFSLTTIGNTLPHICLMASYVKPTRETLTPFTIAILSTTAKVLDNVRLFYSSIELVQIAVLIGVIPNVYHY